jgi:hypothetical protein
VVHHLILGLARVRANGRFCGPPAVSFAPTEDAGLKARAGQS